MQFNYLIVGSDDALISEPKDGREDAANQAEVSQRAGAKGWRSDIGSDRHKNLTDFEPTKEIVTQQHFACPKRTGAGSRESSFKIEETSTYDGQVTVKNETAEATPSIDQGSTALVSANIECRLGTGPVLERTGPVSRRHSMLAETSAVDP